MLLQDTELFYGHSRCGGHSADQGGLKMDRNIRKMGAVAFCAALLSLLLLAVSCPQLSSGAEQELVINGDFSTGDATGWVLETGGSCGPGGMYETVDHGARVYHIGAGSCGQGTRLYQSPQGEEKIVFCSNQTGNWEIWCVDSDGSNLTRLTRTSWNNFSPEISPSGRWIAYCSDKTGKDEIWVMNGDGSRPRQVTDVAEIGRCDVRGFGPQWSPDETRIFYTYGKAGCSEGSSIYSIRVDGTDNRCVLDRSVTGCCENYNPAIDHQGRYLVYVCDCHSSPTARTQRYNLETGENLTIISGIGCERLGFDWKPDDSEIAFHMGCPVTPGSADLCVMAPDGSDRHCLIDDPAPIEDMYPCWSPDGAQMVYVHNDDYTNPRSRASLWVVNADGTGPHQLYSSGAKDHRPSWGYLVTHIPAVIDFEPDVLNPRSGGRWVTCYVELPEGYDPADIDVSTVLLSNTVPAEMAPTEVGDYDGDGIPDLMVKFSRPAVIAVLPGGEQVELRVSGEVAGQHFAGADTIRVLMPRVTYPNGGEVLVAGEQCTITWEVPAGLNPGWYSVYYATDDGSSWHAIASGIQGTSCGWAAPNVAFPDCRVLVEAYDGEGITGYDISDSTFTVSSASDMPAGEGTPDRFDLYTTNPNAANRSTVIRFTLPEPCHVNLSVHDVRGRLIAELIDEVRPADSYSLNWNVADTAVAEVPAGIYFLRFEAGTFTTTAKIVLVR
jgi:TolB protein